MILHPFESKPFFFRFIISFCTVFKFTILTLQKVCNQMIYDMVLVYEIDTKIDEIDTKIYALFIAGPLTGRMVLRA